MCIGPIYALVLLRALATHSDLNCVYASGLTAATCLCGEETWLKKARRRLGGDHSVERQRQLNRPQSNSVQSVKTGRTMMQFVSQMGVGCRKLGKRVACALQNRAKLGLGSKNDPHAAAAD